MASFPTRRDVEKSVSTGGVCRLSCAGIVHRPSAHNVGTNREFDKTTDKFYTPPLIEVWRTAPYLHDGSAETIQDVLTTRNASGQHGDLTKLSNQEINDLCEYVLSL